VAKTRKTAASIELEIDEPDSATASKNSKTNAKKVRTDPNTNTPKPEKEASTKQQVKADDTENRPRLHLTSARLMPKLADFEPVYSWRGPRQHRRPHLAVHMKAGKHEVPIGNLPQALETLIKQTWGSERALKEWAASQPPASAAKSDQSNSACVAEESSGHTITKTASQQISGHEIGRKEQQATADESSAQRNSQESANAGGLFGDVIIAASLEDTPSHAPISLPTDTSKRQENGNEKSVQGICTPDLESGVHAEGSLDAGRSRADNKTNKSGHEDAVNVPREPTNEDQRNKRKRQGHVEVEVERAKRERKAASVAKPEATSQPAGVSLRKFKDAVRKSKRLSNTTASAPQRNDSKHMHMLQCVFSSQKNNMKRSDSVTDQAAADSQQKTTRSSARDASYKSASQHESTNTRKLATVQENAEKRVVKVETETGQKNKKSQQTGAQKLPTGKETKEKGVSKEETSSAQKAKKDSEKKPIIGLLGIQGPYGVCPS
jgi:hypothetical protein